MSDKTDTPPVIRVDDPGRMTPIQHWVSEHIGVRCRPQKRAVIVRVDVDRLLFVNAAPWFFLSWEPLDPYRVIVWGRVGDADWEDGIQWVVGGYVSAIGGEFDFRVCDVKTDDQGDINVEFKGREDTIALDEDEARLVRIDRTMRLLQIESRETKAGFLDTLTGRLACADFGGRHLTIAILDRPGQVEEASHHIKQALATLGREADPSVREDTQLQYAHGKVQFVTRDQFVGMLPDLIHHPDGSRYIIDGTQAGIRDEVQIALAELM